MRYRYLLLLLILSISSPAQTSVNWTVNPFDHKVFVENRGQFDACVSLKDPILFQANMGKVQAFFTGKGITFRYIENPKEENEEKREKEEAERKNGKRSEPKITYLSAFWQNTNPEVKIEAQEAQSDYYTYPMSRKTSIRVTAFKKIVYRNIYPAIDIEYFFPEGKEGIKYDIILHPGADISCLKLKYIGARSTFIDENGNALIKSTTCDLTDHAPVSYYQDNKQKISIHYLLKNREEHFYASETYDKSKTIVIDPWTTSPNLAGINRGYDVDYDNAGNVYAYGGAGTGYELVKINSAGLIQWHAFPTGDPDKGGWSAGGGYGDFCVDKRTGTCYAVEGINHNCYMVLASAWKVNTAGIQVATFGGVPGVGNPTTDLGEMWRVVFNACTGKLIIGGGGIWSNVQAMLLDTDMSTYSTVNALGTAFEYHDVALLAQDPTGRNCYMAFSKDITANSNTKYDNMLIGIPASTLSPSFFQVNEGYNFREQSNADYCPQGAPLNFGTGAGGFNGMAVSYNWLYLYDGATIKRFDKGSGALMKTVAPGSISFGWGGLDVDACDNLYAGYLTSVYVYNASLNQVNTISLTDTVYDLMLDKNSPTLLYVTGNQYVSSLNITAANTEPTVVLSKTNSSACTCNGTANAQPMLCGVPDTSRSIRYLWSNGDTTQSLKGLCPGTYTVSVTLGPCMKPATDSITIPPAAAPPTMIKDSTKTKCSANDGSASVTLTGGLAPYTYDWNPGPSAITSSPNSQITDLGAGKYCLTVSDQNGCQLTTCINVQNSDNMQTNAVSTNISCFGSSNGTATATVSGGDSPYTYSWSNGVSSITSLLHSFIPSLSEGSYTVTISDINGCSSMQTLAITQPTAALSAIESTTAALCGQSNGSAAVTISGGTPAYAYTWSGAGTSVSGSPVFEFTDLAAGPYSLIITDNNGCPDTINLNVPGTATFTLTSVPENEKCFGDCNASLSATVAGNTAPYTYLWSPGGQNTSTISNLCKGIYTLSATDKNGCGSIVIDTVGQPAALVLPSSSKLKCNDGSSANLYANITGGVSPYVYSWSSSGNLANGTNTTDSISENPAITSTYTIQATDANGCIIIQTDTITLNPTPQAAYTGPNVCIGLSTIFRDSSYISAGQPAIAPGTQGGSISSWDWNFGDGTSSSSQNPSHVYQTAGTYTVSLTVSTGYCSSETTHTVTVYPDPQANFSASPQPTTVLNTQITFTDNSIGGIKNILSYWNLGDGMPDIVFVPGNNPTHTYPAENIPGGETFTIKQYIVNQFGCPDSISKTIFIGPEWTFYVPDAFTPNGDNVNDTFYGTGWGIQRKEMWIWDRWGMLIFHTTDLNGVWDGRVEGGTSGQIVQQDVYVWRIEIEDVFLNNHKYMGHVTVVK